MNKKEELVNILKSQNTWMSSQELSALLNVSQRTVKSYVKSLNEMSSEKIVDSSNYGYMYVSTISEFPISKGKNEIKNLLLSKLLITNEEGITLYQMSCMFNYSEQQIKRILSDIEKIVEEKNLLVVKTKTGYMLKGTERNKRKLLSELIYAEAKSSYVDEDLISHYFPTINGLILKKLILNEMKLHKVYVNDFVVNSLMLHLSIYLDRYISPVNNVIVNTNLSTEFINSLENNFNIVVTQECVDTISELFGLKVYQDSKLEVTDQEIDTFFEDIEKFILKKFGNSTIKKRMKLHLENFVKRANIQKMQKNPMKQLIKIRSPLIYESAYYAMAEFCGNRELEFTDDEVGFIAIHIGMEVQFQNQTINKISATLYCPSYFNLSADIKEKIEYKFSSDIYINKITENQVDLREETGLIISLIDLNLDNKYIVTISPLLAQSDFEQLHQIIKRYKVDSNRIKLFAILKELTSIDYFWSASSSTNREDVLNQMISKLLKDNIINHTYKGEVDERERLSSTAFNLVAVPHALQYNAKESKLAIFINSKPISWDESNVHIVFLLVTNNDDKKLFVDLFDVLSNFFEDTKLQTELINTKKLDEFIEVFVKGIK